MSSSPSPPPDATAEHNPTHETDSNFAPAGGSRVGPYKLLQALGEGGMGTVYLAEQHEPVRRRVAVKLIKPGMDSAQVVARFEAERQALALMDHPNIAKVLDAGTTEHGRPYFVMELVKGVPITKFCDDARMTVRERAELFVSVCRAIAHAHQKGIIHRDIKPSNVLVALVDGKPVPKVIDFGVAKAVEQPLTERTVYTQIGAAVGTWEYMSPEQAEGSPLGVDTRSDVYSLGVLLYELLTGTTPLQRRTLSGGFTEVLRVIREVEPPVPSARLSSTDTPATVASRRRAEPAARLAHLVKGELDWIVMTALAKDRGERYESANALADDVRRYLDGDRVKAVPPSARYRFKKFLRRNKSAVAAAAVVFLALVLGVIGSAWQASRAQTERDRAVAAQDALRLTLTRQVARQMEQDLMRLSAIGEGLVATMQQAEGWDEQQLEEWKRRMLKHDPNIYGLCVAYEPDTVDLRPKSHPARQPGRPDANDPLRDGYSFYVYHKDGAVDPVAEPLKPKYKYRTQKWYVDTLREKKAAWTEPFFDEHAGDIPMVTYAAPLTRRGATEPVGVMAVDLSLTYFQRPWLNDPTFGEGSYGFVMSRTGKVISHPKLGKNPFSLKEGGLKSVDIRDVLPDQEFRDVVERILAKTGDAAGQEVGTDPATGQRSRFLYARFNPAGWFFVAVIPDEPR